jgi:predicted pyridoxine 5'-phosphate oxidase superfamily flavin-nucleotide-binding protein
MKESRSFASDVAFTPAVKELQRRKGSREAYARMEKGRGWHTRIDRPLASFIAEQRSFFLATASRSGQPYIQHRGGPPGFLRVLDEQTLAFADFAGNRQYISMGNLAENPKVHLFLVDYARRIRIKIWGEAAVVEGDARLLESLRSEGYDAEPEQAFVIRVTAWDRNCPQHIPRLFAEEEIAAVLAEREAQHKKIADLEEQLRQLRARLPAAH